MHVRIRLTPAPPPPHFLCQIPVIYIPLWRLRCCSWGCQIHSIFISIIPSSGSAASSSYLTASIPHKHPSTLTHLLFLRFLCSSISSIDPAARQSYSGLICHPASSSSPSTQLGLPLQPPPFRPLHCHPLSDVPFQKKQASCLFFLQKCLLAGQLVFHCPCGG